MASALSLNFGISPPATCRTEIQPERCSLGDKSFMKGGQTMAVPNGAIYHTYGMTVSHYNDGLKMPQMRPWLGPEYFNSGCTSLYGKDSTMCPNSMKAAPCTQSKDMFDYLFESHSDFTGNNAPPACFGGKCSGYDSTLGWETHSSGQGVKWQNMASTSSCGATYP